MIFVNNIHLFKIKSILHVCELLYTIVKYLHAVHFAAAAVALTMFVPVVQHGTCVRLACPIEELVEAADVVSFTVEVDSLGFNVLVFDSIPVAAALVNVVNR